MGGGGTITQPGRAGAIQIATANVGNTATFSIQGQATVEFDMYMFMGQIPGDVRFTVGIERAANSHLSDLLSIVNPVLGTIELNIVGAHSISRSLACCTSFCQMLPGSGLKTSSGLAAVTTQAPLIISEWS